MEQLKQQYRELLRQNRNEEAREFYYDNLFQHVERRFIAHVDEKIKTGAIPRYEYLAIPMGLEDSYYIMLINAFKPKYVYFLCTKEAERLFLDNVIKRTGLLQQQYDKEIINYEEMDLAEVYKRIVRKLDAFRHGSKTAIDLTRGKRVMSAAAAIVGDFFGCDLVYIDEAWWDDVKRGEPCTEKLVRVKGPLHIFGELEKKFANELFNAGHYGSSAMIFRALAEKLSNPREPDAKSLIADAYDCWDSFNYLLALRKMEQALEKAKKHELNLNLVQLEKNFRVLGLLQKVQSNEQKDALHDRETTKHLLVDLFLNAQRRKKHHRLEDAIARYYRMIELISQHGLSKYGIADTSNADYSRTAGLQEKYGETTEKLYGVRKTLPKEISVKDGHIMLYALNDEFWRGVPFDELKTLFDVLRLRDRSLVAHGVEIISQKAYEKFERITRGLMARFCESEKELDRVMDQHAFIKVEE